MDIRLNGLIATVTSAKVLVVNTETEEGIELTHEQFLEIARLLLTGCPLTDNDPRLRFTDDVREMIVRVDDVDNKWMVLDGLRAVSRRKLRHKK